MTASANGASSIWDETSDVVVVGSGAGGMTGAYCAAREGLSVTLVEASDRFGGTTAYSGGGMWFPCCSVLQRAGRSDSLADAKTYFHAVVGDSAPVELQDAFVENGAVLADYLEADDAFEFMPFPWPDYFGLAPKASPGDRHILPCPLQPEQLGRLRDLLRPALPADRAGHPLPELVTGGQALIGRFLLALSRLENANLRLNTTCNELVLEHGRVVGIVVTQDGAQRRIRANRGVIVASGGFERNQDMRTRHSVPGDTRGSMGPASNQGHAIQAAIDIGADVALMSEAWWSPGITHPDGTSTFSLWFLGGIFVDDNGQRFVNESMAYDRIGREILARVQAGALTMPYWMIYDDRDGERPPVRATGVPMGESKDFEAAGLWFTADTVEELAEKIGVPAANLSATVARFNEMANAGEDAEFGRGEETYDRAFSDGGSPLVPIEKGPFHAAAFGLSDLGTKGGLRTDATARVLDREGAVIPGLYAAGNSMAAASGTAYPGGGNPVGASMVFSYLAVLDLVGAPQ